MHPEIEKLRPRLKEILYDCAVELRATKAALYLSNGEGRFELVSEYGFRSAVRQSADEKDAAIDRCGRGRTPFFINGVASEPRFSELLYESGTDRLLAAPIYLRGALVGMIDMRDKAEKQPFDMADLPKAQSIADRMAALFKNMNVFGQRFISMATAAGEAVAPVRQPLFALPPTGRYAPIVLSGPGWPSAPPITVPQAPVPVTPAPMRVPRLATLVDEARTAAGDAIIASPLDEIGETELGAARELMRAILLIPGAVVATFSALSRGGGHQECVSRAPLAEEATAFLRSKLDLWLSRRGESMGPAPSHVSTPLNASAPSLVSAQMQKVFTAPVVVAGMSGIFLTVAFSETPDRTAHEMLAVFLGQLQVAVEHSLQRSALKTLRESAAQKLLEPEFLHYPALRRHTMSVVSCADEFARFLALGPADTETLRLVAMTHDVGLRVLDYEHLYGKPKLSQDELSILHEHVFTGAAIVAPVLGNNVARAVLAHHERVDGTGYPHSARGEEIPLVARILQLCDAWVAMTDSETYKPAVATRAALSEIARAAGSQFDAELARRFVESVRSR